ncbi:MAG: hypothetical protein J07HN6_00671 [Halonotius sp. J07HN6]|nr:MAG: hypothetical protein J07HN6_00671 [Halonotius sp. J07HN6]
MTATTHYAETQYFRQAWLWALLVISSVPAALLGIVAIVTDADAGTNVPLWVGIVLAAVVGPLILFYRANLRIEARDTALRLRLWPFHLRSRTVSYSDIESITATEISPISDFGGVGVRLQPSVYRWGVRFDEPVGYIVNGKQAVRIERTDGKTLVVTATDPHALVRSVEQLGNIED